MNDRQSATPLSSAVEVVGLIAGLVALVYLLGGFVVAIRLGFDGFSAESIVAVVGQLPRETVVTVGLVEALGPAVLTGLLAALSYAAFARPRKRDHKGDGLNTGRWWGLVFAGSAVLTTALLIPAVLQAYVTDGPSLTLAAAVMGWIVTYASVLLGRFALRRLGRISVGWYRATRGLVAGCVWAGIALTPAVIVAGAIALDAVRACTTDSDVPEDGALIAQTSTGVLMAVDAGARQSVVSLPAGRVTKLAYGERLCRPTVLPFHRAVADSKRQLSRPGRPPVTATAPWG